VPDCCRRNLEYRTAQALIRYTHRRKDRNLGHYVRYLERVERGKYDTAGALIRERLEGSEAKARTIDLGVPIRKPIRIPPPEAVVPSARPWPSLPAPSSTGTFPTS
jgi:hypothetical protein